MSEYVRWFEEISHADIPDVGGKNASLGEMYRELSKEGIEIPYGFVLTSDAYRRFLRVAQIDGRIGQLIKNLDTKNVPELQKRARAIREIIVSASFDDYLRGEITQAYVHLCKESGGPIDVAVRSSATAEDLPEASFAGQQESFLNVSGERAVLQACKQCFASLFTERAISYRAEQGFEHEDVALSVGVQKMVRADMACSGVIFTLDPDSGYEHVVLITGVHGLGEPLVQGRISPDEFYVFKPTLREGYRAILAKHLGSKWTKMIYAESGQSTTTTIRASYAERSRLVLNDDEILTLARWGCKIEEHFSERLGRSVPMDIEWAKDGRDGKLYIVQARPETVVSQREQHLLRTYHLKQRGEVLLQGQAIGQRIGQGVVRICSDISHMCEFQVGEVLVADTTDPDWEPVMEKASAIITNRGGRTSHAAIVSRELGVPCVVGTEIATDSLRDGQEVTVSCAEGEIGEVHKGLIEFEVKEVELSELPATGTKICMNVSEPRKAFTHAALPHDGVGLARIEFILSSYIGIHPRALIDFEQVQDPATRREIDKLTWNYPRKADYFIERLTQGIALIAAAFYPKQVIVRCSDFKSNEYARLLGGEQFEPKEENPMLGWRGASRYYDERFRSCFGLECEAIKRVYHTLGLKNIIPMVPFCRTPEEARKVIETFENFGVHQSDMPIYGMCEIPSNVLLADRFLDIFDGLSIGSNDLTQLVLGVDRDSSLVAHLFSEVEPSVQELIRRVIECAHRRGKYIGICGDAPSSNPDILRNLVELGIDTISVTPDVLLKTRIAVAELERELGSGSSVEESGMEEHEEEEMTRIAV